MKKIVAQYPVHQGYTCAHRRILEYEDGHRVFAKTATNEETARWLRKEYALYEHFGEHSFLAKLEGWEDDGTFPTIYLEDLSHAHWPPAWHEGHIEQVLDTLKQVNELPPMGLTRKMSSKSMFFKGWQVVAEDPTPFLSLGMCSQTWLDGALPTLLKQQASVSRDQKKIIHRDVRSDNMCFVDGRLILIDWNWTSLGPPEVDVVSWLPSLQAEGGPAPEDVFPESSPWIAAASGLWASQAGLPQVPEAPRVRYIQRLQLSYALPWAQRAYDLPPLDGDVLQWRTE